MQNILTLEEVQNTKQSYNLYSNGDYLYRVDYRSFAYIRNGKNLFEGRQISSCSSFGGKGFEGGLEIREGEKLKYINVNFFKKLFLYCKNWKRLNLN